MPNTKLELMQPTLTLDLSPFKLRRGLGFILQSLGYAETRYVHIISGDDCDCGMTCYDDPIRP